MKQTLTILIFSLFLVSGCEMTIGIPKSDNAAAPKNVSPIELKSVEGRTPLEILQHDKKDVQMIAYPDWGSYVIQIGNVKNETELGPEGRYWVLYVNGEQVKEGTDRVRLKGTEKVEFRFEKPKGNG